MYMIKLKDRYVNQSAICEAKYIVDDWDDQGNEIRVVAVAYQCASVYSIVRFDESTLEEVVDWINGTSEVEPT